MFSLGVPIQHPTEPSFTQLLDHIDNQLYPLFRWRLLAPPTKCDRCFAGVFSIVKDKLGRTSQSFLFRLSPVPLKGNTEPEHWPNLPLFAPACFSQVSIHQEDRW